MLNFFLFGLIGFKRNFKDLMKKKGKTL